MIRSIEGFIVQVTLWLTAGWASFASIWGLLNIVYAFGTGSFTGIILLIEQATLLQQWTPPQMNMGIFDGSWAAQIVLLFLPVQDMINYTFYYIGFELTLFYVHIMLTIIKWLPWFIRFWI